nr:MAG TPA: hypothetical protein [Caudoviricetes sp.]
MPLPIGLLPDILVPSPQHGGTKTYVKKNPKLPFGWSGRMGFEPTLFVLLTQN